jgi:hypothetical protein
MRKITYARENFVSTNLYDLFFYTAHTGGNSIQIGIGYETADTLQKIHVLTTNIHWENSSYFKNEIDSIGIKLKTGKLGKLFFNGDEFLTIEKQYVYLNEKDEEVRASHPLCRLIDEVIDQCFVLKPVNPPPESKHQLVGVAGEQLLKEDLKVMPQLPPELLTRAGNLIHETEKLLEDFHTSFEAISEELAGWARANMGNALPFQPNPDLRQSGFREVISGNGWKTGPKADESAYARDRIY